MAGDESSRADTLNPTTAPPPASDDDRTATAPRCPTPMTPMAPMAHKDRPVPVLAPEQIIDDYRIIRLLGSGGFASVYLARQISLDRLVALKVSANQGSEAQTLAKLEHQHIVQVFAEIPLADRNLRLLSIQFVPGTTLARLIHMLAKFPPEFQGGETFFRILDDLCTEPTTLDLSGLELRTSLESCDHVELACWLGARLAEALAHAHSEGVIHRDIKPANILLNRYGRPLLADFNIALDTKAGTGSFGGTVAYMAPEQLDAFLPGADPTQAAVDARSDLYSLAVVLFEFLTGQLPFAHKIGGTDRIGSLRQLSRERHAAAPSVRARRADIPELMDRLLGRCLDPEPSRRFQTAAGFMHALDGCRDLLRVDKEPDRHTRLVQSCLARPFRMLVLLGVLPHVAGSVVNILYNEQLIVTKDLAQRASFQRLVLCYNAVAYPLLLVVTVIVLRRAWLGWERLRTHADLTLEETARIRKQALGLPGWIVLVSCIGWFPGGIIFPLGMHLDAGPLAAGDFIHFLISFVLSGLIATTYAYFAAQFVVLRGLYPRMWSDPSSARETMQAELRGVPAQLRFFQFIAVLIPLVGAALLIGAGPDQLTVTFRILVTALIVLGLVGFFLATRICTRLTQFVTVLTAP